jgi:hypothetical protein
MKHATSRELFDYWNRVRDGAPAPQRGDIEPSDIRRILADTFILECADREHYPIRLAGTRICGLLCREIKGDDFRSLWRSADQDAIATLGTAISSDAAAAVVTVGADTDRGRTLAAEVLMLPLRSGGRANDRIFGSFAPFERPYWVGTEPISTLTIVSLRPFGPTNRRNSCVALHLSTRTCRLLPRQRPCRIRAVVATSPSSMVARDSSRCKRKVHALLTVLQLVNRNPASLDWISDPGSRIFTGYANRSGISSALRGAPAGAPPLPAGEGESAGSVHARGPA